MRKRLDRIRFRGQKREDFVDLADSPNTSDTECSEDIVNKSQSSLRYSEELRDVDGEAQSEAQVRKDLKHPWCQSTRSAHSGPTANSLMYRNITRIVLISPVLSSSAPPFHPSPGWFSIRPSWDQRSSRNRLVRETLLTWVFCLEQWRLYPFLQCDKWISWISGLFLSLKSRYREKKVHIPILSWSGY